MTSGHLFIDAHQLILREYRSGLGSGREPGPGHAFVRWVLTNEWSQKVTRVPLTPRTVEGEDYEELPPPPEGVRYDPSDRKFLAVAAAHREKPPVLQALDSKWWGWRQHLEAAGVKVRFLCPDEIQPIYQRKMGK
jgi:hypothetical protein